MLDTISSTWAGCFMTMVKSFRSGDCHCRPDEASTVFSARCWRPSAHHATNTLEIAHWLHTCLRAAGTSPPELFCRPFKLTLTSVEKANVCLADEPTRRLVLPVSRTRSIQILGCVDKADSFHAWKC